MVLTVVFLIQIAISRKFQNGIGSLLCILSFLSSRNPLVCAMCASICPQCKGKGNANTHGEPCRTEHNSTFFPFLPTTPWVERADTILALKSSSVIFKGESSARNNCLPRWKQVSVLGPLWLTTPFTGASGTALITTLHSAAGLQSCPPPGPRGDNTPLSLWPQSVAPGLARLTFSLL